MSISRGGLARALEGARPWVSGERILEYIEAEGWLRDPAEPTPGLTITASKFDEAVESCVTEDATVPPHTFAARLGVVCVPDPEPTNAEKLAKLLDDVSTDAGVNLNPRLFAERLDQHGVKAPGGDDE